MRIASIDRRAADRARQRRCTEYLPDAPVSGLQMDRSEFRAAGLDVSQNPSHNLHLRGFSLVELMICLVLVAMLLSLLLAAIATARISASRVSCAANLAQIGRHVQIYANSYAGWVQRNCSEDPPYVDTHKSWLIMLRHEWAWITAAELSVEARSVRLLKCPSHPQADQLPSSYIVNAFACTDDRPRGGKQIAGPTRLSQVRNPSNVVLLTDVTNSMGFFDGSDMPYAQWLEWPVVLDVFAGGHLPNRSEFTVVLEPQPRIARSRHGRGWINVLFFDGSVRCVESDALRVRDFDDGIRDHAHRRTWPGPYDQ